MSKKHKNILIAIVIVLIFALLMIFSNLRRDLSRQLQGPIEGTGNVFTLNDNLFVVSKNNHIYTWQWNNLSLWPVVAKPSAAAIMPFANDKIVYYFDSLNKLVLTDLKAAKELGSLSTSYGAKCKKIKTSHNGRFGLVSMTFTQGTQKDRFKLGLFDYDFKELSYVFQKNTAEENFVLYDFTITDDGNFIAGAGQKDNAWVFVSDVNSGEILWEKTFNEYDSFTLVRFSPDGKQLFAAEKIRHILVFDTKTGQLLKTFIIDKYPTPPNKKQVVSAITISPDGLLFAASTEPSQNLFIWNAETGKKLTQFGLPGPVLGGIAFSPNSDMIASGILVRSTIHIWKVSELK